MTKKQIKEEAKRLVTDFQHQHFNCSMLVAKEMTKKTIAEIQRVLVYFPEKDGYGCDWREYFKDVAAEVEKMTSRTEDCFSRKKQDLKTRCACGKFLKCSDSLHTCPIL